MKFLVIQQKMIGDVLASTVICESIKDHFPQATVHMVANENTLAVLKENPFIDEILIFKNAYRNDKKSFYRFLTSLKNTEYTAVFDAYGKLESNLITLFTSAKRKIGNYKWYTSWIYTDTIRQNKIAKDELPLSITNRLMLLQPIVEKNGFVPFPKIYLSSQELKIASETISKAIEKKGRKLIMISILGSAPHKTYPAKYMARVLDLICESGEVNLLFNYLPQQQQEALAIFEFCAPVTQDRILFDFYATSLRDFLGILSQCDVLIGNEGGAVNMAKALHIPTFCIFSPYINKDGWHGKIQKKHVGVHLKDYYPELFGTMSRKELKKKSHELYEAYKPELFEKVLLDFLINHAA